jgi:hypothetical protein
MIIAVRQRLQEQTAQRIVIARQIKALLRLQAGLKDLPGSHRHDFAGGRDPAVVQIQGGNPACA